jgi:thioredoxin-like negative regulator of GroEL
MTRNTRAKTRKTKNVKKGKVRFGSRVTVHKIEPTNVNKFKDEINNMNGPVLIHSPQCMHCIELRPKWEQVIKELNNRQVNCKILEVNADVLQMTNHPLGKQIDGVPAIFNMEKGKTNAMFSDERNVENMLQFVLKHLKDNKNLNLPFNYNLNKKGNLKKITNPNNIKKLRRTRNTKRKGKGKK